MLFEEIKKDCLRSLGFILYGDGDGIYTDVGANRYLNALKNPILRAYDRMISLNVIPYSYKELPDVLEDGFYDYDLSVLIGKGVFNGAYVFEEGEEELLSCLRRKDKIRVPRRPADGAFVKYLAYIGDPDKDKEADLPDSLARLIPYFVKSELMEEDEPSLAFQARNIFEKSLEEYAESMEPQRLKLRYEYK